MHGIRRERFRGISIHAPPRGATGPNGGIPTSLVTISIHAPPRGATIGQNAEERRGIYFNSRPSARGDADLLPSARVRLRYFNSRPSARGDRNRPVLFRFLCLFQFTPLREGRHAAAVLDEIADISIHAPPRGATGRRRCRMRAKAFQFTPLREGRHPHKPRCVCRVIFQFTPLREGRRGIGYGKLRQSTFQFTPLREGRPALWQGGHAPSPISIHAPPRGATRFHIFRMFCTLFQFTPLREGRRQRFRRIHPAGINFNSRPSARGDLATTSATYSRNYFNSRPSARGDLAVSKCQRNRKKISIHAPPRGATLSSIHTSVPELFQFTPLREGRRKNRKKVRKRAYFNSRPSARGDGQFCPQSICH